jgi:uncharacterized protein YggU (UPF0235/DUF167 family)
VTGDPLAPWRGAGPVLIPVRVTPGARREAIEAAAAPDGTPMLRVAVRAVAEDGRANAAVCALVAEALGLARSAVSVARGASGRQKLLRVERRG